MRIYAPNIMRSENLSGKISPAMPITDTLSIFPLYRYLCTLSVSIRPIRIPTFGSFRYFANDRKIDRIVVENQFANGNHAISISASDEHPSNI